MIHKQEFLRTTRKNTKEYKFIIICDYCKREFEKIGCNIQSRFCSRHCLASYRNKFLTNHKKTSISLSKFYSKHMVWNKGKTKLTNSSIQKMANTLRDPLSNNMKIRKLVEYREKISKRTSGVRNPFFGKSHTKEFREKQSITRSEQIANGKFQLGYNRFWKGWYFSTKNNCKFFYDSFWELLRMKILDIDENVIMWTKRHKIRIPYVLNGICRNYVPDFLITYKNNTIIEEIKGWEPKDKKTLKFEGLKKYCLENNMHYNILQHLEMKKLAHFYFGKSIELLRKEYRNV